MNYFGLNVAFLNSQLCGENQNTISKGLYIQKNNCN